MNTLRIVSIAVGFILGIVAAIAYGVPVPGIAVLPFCVAGLALTAWLFRRERQWKEFPVILLILAAVLFALPLGYWRAMQRLGPPAPGTLRHVFAALPDRAPIGLRGQISAEPELRGNGWGEVDLRVSEVRANPTGAWQRVGSGKVLLRVYPPRSAQPAALQALNRLTDPAAYGYRLEVQGAFEKPVSARNPGEFDPAEFLLQNDLLAQMRCKLGDVTILEESRGNWFVELAMAAKRNFLVTYKSTIRDPASRLIAGATLGARRALDLTTYRGSRVTQSFRHSGVGHVLAVSGLHVSIVAILLYGLFHTARIKPRQFTPFLIFFLLLFAVLTGARPSSLRAVIMNSVTLIALSYLRTNLRYAAFIGLSVSSFFILLFNPIVLFSPGFLLSYGAVLSLALVTRPLNQWIVLLRGFSAFFSVLWFGALVLLFCLFPRPFMAAPAWLGAAGSLWLLIVIGGRLNERFPVFYGLGFDRMPATLRMFLCAQLGIQAGMMIPLSAWFFGQFPVAGIFVNLIAIPAIGVVIQLGMLTGILGLLPQVGEWLARPIGAAATLSGDFFYWIVWLGQRIFPLHPVPRPTLVWMILYYVALGCLLAVDSWKLALQRVLYRAWPRLRHPRLALALTYLPPLLLAAAPLYWLAPHSEHAARVICFAAGRYPAAAVISDRGRAVAINGGGAFTGAGLLFQGIRSQGAMELQTAVLCGPQPEAGTESLATLAPKMPPGVCYVPIIAPTGQFVRAIGDDYLSDNAARGERWATRYETAHDALLAALGEAGTRMLPIEAGPLAAWSDMRLEALPGLTRMPKRFVTSARTALVALHTRGYRWLIVTDATPESLTAALADDMRPYDVVMLPDLSSRKSYREMVETAVSLARPRVVILSGKDMPSKDDFDAKEWARQHQITLLATAADGAIIASFDAKGEMILTGRASGRMTILTSQAPAPRP